MSDDDRNPWVARQINIPIMLIPKKFRAKLTIRFIGFAYKHLGVDAAGGQMTGSHPHIRLEWWVAPEQDPCR